MIPGHNPLPQKFRKKLYVRRNRGPLLHRSLCLLIVALAVKNPDYKIPDADECEQRSEETPKENPAPLAERTVEDQIGTTKQRDVPLPNAAIREGRNRPA